MAPKDGAFKMKKMYVLRREPRPSWIKTILPTMRIARPELPKVYREDRMNLHPMGMALL